MLKVLRRTGRSQPDATVAGVATVHKTDFFDLPGEIRNTIYDLTARSTTVRLLERKKRRTTAKDLVTAPPSLFLTSKQCRQEYLPILLSTAYIEAFIVNFDFSNVVRVAKSLFSTELRALRCNPHLMLLLLLPRIATKDETANLRRWATYRADALDRLPWNYSLAPESASVENCKVRAQCADRISFLSFAVDEPLQYEMHRMWEIVHDGTADDTPSVQYDQSINHRRTSSYPNRL